MSEYRDEIRHIERESRWTFFRFLSLSVIIAFISLGLFFTFHSFGVLGRTVVERKVFENSYQRSEAIKSQIAIDEASLAEIERNLRNPNLDESTRHALDAQASAIRIRINSARSR